MLRVDHVTKSFGGLVAVHDVSFEVHQGEIVGIIGPNGAGKTTLFGVISGFYPPNNGHVFFNEEQIDGLRPDQICKRGLVRTFQIMEIFPKLTIYDCILAAALNRYSIANARKKAEDILKRLGLGNIAHLLMRSITTADAKKVELARALATGPKLLLLDEVMSGLTPVEAQEIVELIKKLRDEGLTFVVVEHVMPVIMNLCEKILVLDFGSKIAEGNPKEICSNRQVINSYLGEVIMFA
jgi:branched-chain amino acid transport system ATP-binding protein